MSYIYDYGSPSARHAVNLYHREMERRTIPVKTAPDPELKLPTVEEGVAVPIIYGKCRVTRPILVWASEPVWVGGNSGHGITALFVLGMFPDGGMNLIHGMWTGPEVLDASWSPIGTNVGAGGPESGVTVVGPIEGGGGATGTGLLEMLNGGASQTLAATGTTTTTAATRAGRFMLTSSATAGGGGLVTSRIPGYRGYLSAFLHGINATQGWLVGPSGNIPPYTFLASSYTSGTYDRIGNGMNPITVAEDLITSKRGRGAIDRSTYIDTTSFDAAKAVLYSEGDSFAGVIDRAAPLGDHLIEIARQVDCVWYEDSYTGKLKVKLIRPDFAATSIRQINRNNARMVSFTIAGRSTLINRVEVTWTDPSRGYKDAVAVAENTASTTASGGQSNTLSLKFPYVTDAVTAAKIAARELAARSRPFIKCRMLCDRSFYNTNPGDAVKLLWSAPGVSNVVMRVTGVDRGTRRDSKITLDLLQDYFAIAPRTGIPQPPKSTTKGNENPKI